MTDAALQTAEAASFSFPLTISLNVEMRAVESSNLQAVGFSPALGLVIQFKLGGVYSYPGVLFETYEALLSSNSKGRFFHANIKPLPFVKLLG